MVLGWLGGTKGQSLADLIARKQYSKAVDALKAEFEKGDRSPRLRLQFADVLVMAGRFKEAFPILLALADDFARDGFAAKAIAVLKKAEKIQPSSVEVDRRLAGLIVEKSRSLTITSTGSFKAPAFDMEEISDAPAALPLVPPPPRGVPVRAPEPRPEPEPEPRNEADVELSDEFDLGQELVSLLQQSVEEEQSPEPPAPPMKSIPLFGDLSEAEFIELAHGFNLRSFQPGDIVISSGERGDSLFALTTGTVKAFVRNPDGKHVQVREMREGDFFGEISILTGQPRTATITAATRCELLELDRATLDDIKKRHPRVLQVLHEFSQKRQGSAAEQRARTGKS